MPHFINIMRWAINTWEVLGFKEIERYLVISVSIAAALMLLWLMGVRLRKLHDRKVTATDIRRDFFTSLRSAGVHSITAVGIYFCATKGIMTIYHGPIGWKGMPYFVITTLGLILTHDAYFYWTHRIMHHPGLFKFFHQTHHLSLAPTPLTSYAFNFSETVVLGMTTPLWLLVVPMHVLSLSIFVIFTLIFSSVVHANVELIKPGRLADNRWLGWITSTHYHGLHHSSPDHNFGLYFTWWDRLMGTEHPDIARCHVSPQPRLVVDATETK